MQRLEVSGAVRPLYGSLGFKGLNCCSCGCSVGIVSRLRPGPSIAQFLATSKYPLLLQNVKTRSGVQTTSYSMGNGELSPPVKRAGREADHSPPPPTSQLAFMTRTEINLHFYVIVLEVLN